MKSIKGKLIIYFSILILVGSATLGFFSLTTAKNAVEKEAELALKSMAHEASRYIESRIETQIRTIEMISESLDMSNNQWETLQPILQKQVEGNRFQSLALVYPDGVAHYHDGTKAYVGKEEYIKNALKGNVGISDVINLFNKTMVIYYTAPVYSEGKVVAVLLGQRDGTALSSIADELGYGENGYAYLINEKATVVAHPDRDKVRNKFNPIEEGKKDEAMAPVAEVFEKILEEKGEREKRE